MSDSELVIVDTDDVDPFQAEGDCDDLSIHHSGNSDREMNTFFDLPEDLGSEEKTTLTPNSNKKKKRGRKGNPVPNLTYDKNPCTILIKSGFEVKSHFEVIPDSTEKKCYFSVEGYEISLKFPMRADNRNSENIKKIAAQKAINFIMGLDRVPARLADFMTVPNKSTQLALRIGAKNPVSSTPEFQIRTKQENKRQVLIRKTSTYTYENFRDVCQELVDAGLVPEITFLREQDAKNGVDAQFVTRLPNYEIEFFGEGYNRMSAKLASVSKALKYAKKHGFGNFVPNPPSLSFDSSIPTPTPHHYTPQFRRPSSPHFSSYAPRRETGEHDVWEQPQKKQHISVHSRLAPPLSSQSNTYGNAPTVFQQPYPTPDHVYPSPSNETYDRLMDKVPYFDPAPPERDQGPFQQNPYPDYPIENSIGMPYGNPYNMQSHGFPPYGHWKPPFERGFETPRGFKRSLRRGKKVYLNKH